MRLRILLAVSFALLALGIGLAGALSVQRIAGGRLQNRIGAEMALLAGQVRNQLDTSLAERLSDMQVLATVARSEAHSPEQRRIWVDALQRVYPVYAWIGFAGLDGRVQASTAGILEGADVGARPWFKAGIVAPFFGDLHEALLLASKLPPDPSGEPLRFVDVATPVRDVAGGVIGVVGAHLSWRWIGEASRAAIETVERSSPNTLILIVSEKGEVLLAPPGLAGTALPSDLAKAVASAARPDGHASIEAWPDGRSFLVGTGRSQARTDRPTLGWTVLALQPASIALAASNQLSAEVMTGGILFACMAALLGWWLAGRIAGPLLVLSRAAMALGDRAGDLPAPAGFTEVRQLTGSINGLLQRLAQRDAALAAANRDLEKRVAERTRDLEVERSRAEEAGRVKAEFLATMSHELRTPLTGMLGVHELLRDDPALGPEQRRLLGLAHEAGRSLLVIVNDVLDFSKMDAGQLAIERVSFGLRHLIEGCRMIAAEGAQGRPVRLRARVSPDVPDRILGDPTRLRQVVLNLATNAVKFTPAGEIDIAVSQAGGMLRVEVRDSGIGIAPEALTGLFERFSQADASTTRRFGGTGLGLAICKRLVELMGGEIGATSRPGEGSTFWFTMPILTEEATSSGDAPAARADVGQPIRPRRILLVDDNATNREIVASVLRRFGHEVTEASGGEVAVETIRRGRFDLVLMDVQMPVKDGLMATADIRAIEAREGRRRTPILALTANAMREEAERCRQAGMDGHVSKPVNWDALAAAIEQHGIASDPVSVATTDPDPLGTTPVFDPAVLETLAGYVGEDRIGSLLLAFRSETERRLSELARGESGPKELASAAHILVSMSGQLGFAEMSSVCARLEREARAGDLPSGLDELRHVAGRALAAATASRYAA